MSHSITAFPEGSFIRDLCLITDDYTVFNNCAAAKEELVFFSIFFFVTEKTTLCRHSRCLSVRPSSVEITLGRGFDRSAEPIDLKIGLNMGNWVVHV